MQHAPKPTRLPKESLGWAPLSAARGWVLQAGPLFLTACDCSSKDDSAPTDGQRPVREVPGASGQLPGSSATLSDCGWPRPVGSAASRTHSGTSARSSRRCWPVESACISTALSSTGIGSSRHRKVCITIT